MRIKGVLSERGEIRQAGDERSLMTITGPIRQVNKEGYIPGILA
jgi:hypothetical protein